MFKKILGLVFTVLIMFLVSCDYTGKKNHSSNRNADIPAETPADDPSDTDPAAVSLGALEISPGVLDPEFSPETTRYSVLLPPGISELAITARPAEGCSVRVNESELTSGAQYSTVLQIDKPETVVSILVIAGDDRSASYSLSVTKPVEKTVENSSFEISDERKYPSGWNMAGSGEFVSGSEYSKTGNFSGSFTTLTGSISGREIISSPVEIEQGKKITVSGWFYIPAIDGSSAERDKLGLKIYYFTDAECITPASTAYDTMTKTSLSQQGAWEKLSYERGAEEIPSDTLYVRIGIRACYDSTKGGTKNDKVFIDDISLMQ